MLKLTQIIYRALLLQLGLFACSADAQLYVSNYSGPNGGSVGKYDAVTGAVINPSFITGLQGVTGVAVDHNGHLFVANVLEGAIGVYDVSSGAVINASFISGLNAPEGIVLDSQGNLFVTNFDGRVGKYNAVTGAAINSSFFSAPHPHGIAIDAKQRLYVTTNTLSSVYVFDAQTGAAVASPLVAGGINGIEDPIGIVADGDHLFIANEASGKITQYNAGTGQATNLNVYQVGSPWGMTSDFAGNFYVASLGGSIAKFNPTTGEANAAFISGLSSPHFIAIVPEPGSMWGVACVTLSLMRRRR